MKIIIIVVMTLIRVAACLLEHAHENVFAQLQKWTGVEPHSDCDIEMHACGLRDGYRDPRS